jgi:non-ribosomal peptide synthetase component F
VRVLKSRGVKPGDLIAVSLDHSFGTFVVLLGILKAGCVYVPLDPTLPSLRRMAIATDSRAASSSIPRSNRSLPARAERTSPFHLTARTCVACCTHRAPLERQRESLSQAAPSSITRRGCGRRIRHGILCDVGTRVVGASRGVP